MKLCVILSEMKLRVIELAIIGNAAFIKTNTEWNNSQVKAAHDVRTSVQGIAASCIQQ